MPLATLCLLVAISLPPKKGEWCGVKIKRTGNVSSGTAIILSELWSDNRTTTSKNEILYSPSTSTANVNSYDSSGRYATVVFKAKQKLVKIPYSITNDKLVESSERLYFRIKNAATGTTIGRKSTMYIRVKDDDVAPPTLSLVGGLLVEEGKSSTSYAKLSKALDTDVTFKVSTYKGAYKQANVIGEGGDYLGLTDKSFTIKARRTKVNIPVLTYKNTDPLDSKYESTLLCIESATVPSTVTLGTECDVITIHDVSVAAPPVVKPPPVVTTPPAPDGTPIVTTDLNIYATQVQQLASDIGNEKTVEVMCGEDTASLTKTLASWEKLSLGLLNLVFGNPDCAAAEEIKTVEDLPSLQKVQSTITNGVRIKVRRGEKMSFTSPTNYLPDPNQPIYWTAFQANFLDHYFVRSGDYIDGKKIPLDLSELITLYGDYPGQVKVIGSDADLLVSSESFQGTKAIKVKSNLPNSSLKFHHINGWNTTNFGALTFAIKTDTPSLKIYPSLKLSNGGFMKTGIQVSNYIYGSLGSEWKVAWIPLRDLTANLGNVSISDVIFEFNSAGMVWLDEVKLVEGLWFPLWNTTPYGNSVSAVFDNDRNLGRVESYNGEFADTYYGCEQSWLSKDDCAIWYRQYVSLGAGGQKKLFDFQYFVYNQSIGDNHILDYDQHEGYDYPKPAGTEIHAATSGILCFDSTGSLGGMKRDENKCPKARYNSTLLHPFVILHQNTFLTRYLHAEKPVGAVNDYYGLTKTVYDQIVAKGYAEVKRGDHVGYVGGAGDFPVHLHFETQMRGELIDPYRLNSNLPIGSGVLWTAAPPQ